VNKMPRANYILLAITLILLTACASTKPTSAPEQSASAPKRAFPAPPAARAAPAPAPAPTESTSSRAPASANGAAKGVKKNGTVSSSNKKSSKPLIPARDFCIKGKQCGSEYGAYGYIIFTKRPSTDTRKQRYLSVCNAFITNLEDVGGFSGITNSQIATTFWLLTSQPENEKSCNELIDKYDYARGTVIATSIKKLKSAGPILVASGTPDIPQSEQRELLIIDLSKLTASEMGQVFNIWKDKISQDKKYWEEGFNIPLIVAEFRSFIEKYGDSIIKIVKPS